VSFFRLICKKKSENATHIWVTGCSEEFISFVKLLKGCYSATFLNIQHVSHTLFPLPQAPRLQKIMLSDFLPCHFVHRYGTKMLMTSKEAS
jgi:hypothetical protein